VTAAAEALAAAVLAPESKAALFVRAATSASQPARCEAPSPAAPAVSTTLDHLRRRRGARAPPVLCQKLSPLSADADWTRDAATRVFTLFVSCEVAACAASGGALFASGGLYVKVKTPCNLKLVLANQLNAFPISVLGLQCSCQIMSHMEL